MKYFLSTLTFKTNFYFFESVVVGLVIAFFTTYSKLSMTGYIISSEKKRHVNYSKVNYAKCFE